MLRTSQKKYAKMLEVMSPDNNNNKKYCSTLNNTLKANQFFYEAHLS